MASHDAVSAEWVTRRRRLKFLADPLPRERQGRQACYAEKTAGKQRYQANDLQTNQRREHGVTLVPPHVRAEDFVIFD
jgi:hypothetical protein